MHQQQTHWKNYNSITLHYTVNTGKNHVLFNVSLLGYNLRTYIFSLPLSQHIRSDVFIKSDEFMEPLCTYTLAGYDLTGSEISLRGGVTCFCLPSTFIA